MTKLNAPPTEVEIGRAAFTHHEPDDREAPFGPVRGEAWRGRDVRSHRAVRIRGGAVCRPTQKCPGLPRGEEAGTQ